MRKRRATYNPSDYLEFIRNFFVPKLVSSFNLEGLQLGEEQSAVTEVSFNL